MKRKYAFGENVFVALAMLLVSTLCLSSCQTDDDIPDGPKDDVNTWIYKTMTDYYLWYEEIPAENKLDFARSPEEFFQSLLSDKDGAEVNENWLVFSNIEKQEQETKSDGTTTDSYGFEFASYKLSNNLYYALVLYVLPNSPAAEAGLKRGDWILSVNSETPNITNLSILQKGGKIDVRIGKYNKASNQHDYVKNLNIESARMVEETPFLKDSVYQIGGKHIGYLMYNSFVSGPDNKSEAYNDQMKQLFSKFKARGVNEFVLDLRYNGGGLVSSAQLLTSLLAPAAHLGETFCIMKYNEKHQTENKTLLLKKNSELSNANLDLKRLYVLVGSSTASASEAVINCLIPYIGRSNITLIGEKTVGKTVGSITFGEKEGYGWLLHPIVLRISNSADAADYANGFSPDVPLEELRINVNSELLPLGDTNEYLLREALSRITGQPKSTPAYTKSRSDQMAYPVLDRKRTEGLIYVPEE